MKELSLVIALHNEEENVVPLIDNIQKALKDKFEYEVIFVDDGSSDDTVSVLKAHFDEHFVLVELKRNVGQSAALQAGIDQSSGKYIATMDGDLQNDASDLPKMLETLKEDHCDFVIGIRTRRHDKLFSRKIPSMIANFIVRKITQTDIQDNGCGLKIFKRDVLEEIPLYGEKHRFIASFAAIEGSSYKQVPVKHHPRVHGKSKYGLNRTFKVVADLLVINFSRRFGQKPMYLFGTAGFLTFLTGLAILIILLIQKLFGENMWGRPLLVLGILLIFIGFHTITTGLILDMLVRNNYESSEKKPYRIKNVLRTGKK